MNSIAIKQMAALIKREVLEHPALFLFAPAILAAVLLLFSAWVMNLLPESEVALGIEYAAMLFDGLSPTEMAPLFMVLAIPFAVVFSLCAVIYLFNCLYQDRKDGSVLFWQSMPVSNLRTVLSKIITLVAVVPAFYIAVLFVLYLVAMLGITLLGMSYGVAIAGLGYLFMAALASLLLVYCSLFIASLWLFPTVGWLLLFSAFARRAPTMWAIGVYILLLFLEDFIFGSQFLVNWIESRSNPNQYVIFEFSDLFGRLFNYDMLFGIVVGSILVAGAVMLRRFTD